MNGIPMNEIILLPCPLCGAPAEIAEAFTSVDENRAIIRCTNCGLTLDHAQTFHYYERKDLTGRTLSIVRVANNESPWDVWNRRL